MSNTLPPGPLAYSGISAIPYINETFDPSTSNYQFAVPTIWTNTSSKRAFILVAKPGNVADWVLMASSSGDLSAIDTPDGSTVVPTLGVITFLDGTGMTITGSGSDITFNSSGGGYTWNTVTTTSASLAASNAYVVNDSSLVTLTLPSTADVGDSFLIVGYGSGGWQIGQNASQNVIFGALTSTTGTGGYIASTIQSNVVLISCIVANTIFKVVDSEGNITVF